MQCVIFCHKSIEVHTAKKKGKNITSFAFLEIGAGDFSVQFMAARENADMFIRDKSRIQAIKSTPPFNPLTSVLIKNIHLDRYMDKKGGLGLNTSR